MKKLAVLTVLFLLTAPVASFAVTDVGNKFCPVSGDKVSGKNFVEYDGKRYGLCCEMCDKKFKKDPAKFLAKMAAQEAQEGAEAATHEHAGHVH